MTDSRSRALSTPLPRTAASRQQEEWQQLEKVEKKIRIPLFVKEASDNFPPLPRTTQADPHGRNVEGNDKRKAYGKRGRRNATESIIKRNLQAIGKKVYTEAFDTSQSSGSESVDAVTTLENLHIRGLPRIAVVRDEEGLTDEQQQQAETFQQFGGFPEKVEAALAKGGMMIKKLPPEQQQLLLASMTGLMNRCQGKQPDDPEVKALFSAIHRIAQEGAPLSIDNPSDRMKQMLNPLIQLAELKHLMDVMGDSSFDPDDYDWKTFLVRWPLNFLNAFATVGTAVLLLTFVRGLIGNSIKSAYPDIAVAMGINATDFGDPQAWNSTFSGTPQHQGGPAWGAATAALVMIPHLFNLVALVRQGLQGSVQGHVQVSRLIQFGLSVAVLGIGFSLPAAAGQQIASACTVATFADVLKGLLYSVGRDSFNHIWPKVRANAHTLTVKAVIQDGCVYFLTQTVLGLAFGYLGGIKSDTPVNIPFFGIDLVGGDLAALGAMALTNAIVEALDEISLAYFMRDEEKKQFKEDVLKKNEQGIRKLNERKAEFVKKKLPNILANRRREILPNTGKMQSAYDENDPVEWMTVLDTLTEEESKELARSWEKEVRQYVMEHLTGVTLKLPTWQQTKEKVTDCAGLIDFMFNGRLTTNRAAAMASAFFFSSTALAALPHIEDPTLDRGVQAVAAAITIIAVYLPGILACNRRGFDMQKPANMNRWQAIQYFMGFLEATEVEKEGETVELLSVRSEEEEVRSVDDPLPPNYVPEPPQDNPESRRSTFGSPPIHLESPRSIPDSPESAPESPRSASEE